MYSGHIPKQKKSIGYLVVSFFAIFLFVVLCLAAIMYTFVFSAPQNFPIGTTVFIEPGQSLTGIANEMREKGVVRSSLVLRSTMLLLGSERKVSAGMYEFNESQNVIQLAKRIIAGDFGYVPVKITVPEGTNVFKFADLLHEKFPSIQSEEVLPVIKPLEGQLFPSTYFFAPQATSGMIIERMSKEFTSRIDSLESDIASSTHSLQDIITMASILEGEVQTESDRKIVADLLWRRIENGMPLQVDSTFTYINGKTSAQLTKSDLQIDSPYNTYVVKGLPPTPISNPGIESIKAALYPTPNPYVFFLSDKNGITHFSVTHDEHVRSKELYLK